MRALLNRKPWLAGLALGVFMATLVLWPGISWTGHRLIGHESLDAWSHVWGMRWFTSSFAHGRLPWTITGAGWPEHRVLWYIDPVGALLTAPLQLLGADVAWNGLLFLEVALLGFGGWLWGRALGGQGWLAGMALASSPIVQAEIWNGVSEAAWLAPVAFAGALAVRRSPWTGLAVGVAAVATPYHGIGAAALVGTLLLLGPGAPAPLGKRLGALALAAGIAALLALPHVWLLGRSMTDVGAFVNRSFWSTLNEPVLRSNAVDPVAFVHTGPFWNMENADDVMGAPWRRTPYLGLGLLGLAVVGLVRDRRRLTLLLPLGIVLVGGLGYFLWRDGAWVQSPAGERYGLPLYWLTRIVHIGLDHPMRFAGSAVVVLAGLADAGVGRLGAWLGPLLVVEHLALAPHAWPISTSPSHLPAVYAQIPDDGRAVLDLPADSGAAMRTNRYLYWQTMHGHPVPWTNKVGSMGTASMNPTLRTWVLLSKEGPVTPGSPGVPEPGADLEAALTELETAGLGYVILHRGMLGNRGLEGRHVQSVSALLGPPEEVGEALLWVVPD